MDIGWTGRDGTERGGEGGGEGKSCQIVYLLEYLPVSTDLERPSVS